MGDVLPARLRLVDRLPTGPGWLYEPKFDGYRGIISRDSRGRPAVTSRNGKDLGRFFPEMVGVAERLAPGTVVDGEIVSPIRDGVSFSELQRRLMTAGSDRSRTAAESPVALVAFDLLHDHASDLRKLALRLRRQKLEAIVETLDTSLVQLVSQTDNAVIAGSWLDDRVTMAGIEGVVAKRDEPYPPATVKRWQKVKRVSTMDVLVEGFIGEAESPRLVIGRRDGRKFHVLGTTSPISDEDARTLRALIPRAIPADRPVWSPFDSHRYEEWFVLPKRLVAEVAYTNLDGGSLRHSARFIRWRVSDPMTLRRSRKLDQP